MKYIKLFEGFVKSSKDQMINENVSFGALDGLLYVNTDNVEQLKWLSAEILKEFPEFKLAKRKEGYDKTPTGQYRDPWDYSVFVSTKEINKSKSEVGDTIFQAFKGPKTFVEKDSTSKLTNIMKKFGEKFDYGKWGLNNYVSNNIEKMEWRASSTPVSRTSRSGEYAGTEFHDNDEYFGINGSDKEKVILLANEIKKAFPNFKIGTFVDNYLKMTGLNRFKETNEPIYHDISDLMGGKSGNSYGLIVYNTKPGSIGGKEFHDKTSAIVKKWYDDYLSDVIPKRVKVNIYHSGGYYGFDEKQIPAKYMKYLKTNENLK